MLVLSRKVGEKLIIDGNITVEVVRIQGNRITLGLVAPSNVKILRSELNSELNSASAQPINQSTIAHLAGEKSAMRQAS